MLHSNLLILEDNEIAIVTTIVKLWCEKNHIDLDSDVASLQWPLQSTA
ncbi:hypothetical protein [Rhizobium sp. NXC24]|nr:hypothetical protein [Rhizobium sp. NXC24]